MDLLFFSYMGRALKEGRCFVPCTSRVSSLDLSYYVRNPLLIYSHEGGKKLYFFSSGLHLILFEQSVILSAVKLTPKVIDSNGDRQTESEVLSFGNFREEH